MVSAPRVRSRSLLWAGLAALAGCGSLDLGRPDGSGDSTGSAMPGTDGDDGGTDVPSEFDHEEEFELRLNEEETPPLVLEMNRDEVAELFGDRAQEVLLLELDPTALLTNTLNEVKFACGDRWQLDDPDPQHDCTLTELGQTFSGPDGTWQTSAEYAMVRVLTMTPANADVSGTSSAKLAGLADSLNIGGGFSQILSDALGIPRTQEIVSTPSLVEGFFGGFVKSHPEIGEAGNLRFYLADALTDLATMNERYGPADQHPGVLDPSFPAQGEVFGPDFQMRVVAESNLRLVDGFDADVGKGFLSVVVDEQGPTWDDEVEFDFADPERFQLSGIIEDLVVDLRFAIDENPEFVWSCLGADPCHDNLPGQPVDADSVWALDPWDLEYNVALAAYDQYKSLSFHESYMLGLASIDVGQEGNPLGWVQYSIPLDIGDPPEDQYMWETILEVAQVRLHHNQYTDQDEGSANVAFTVKDIPIGLTGSEAAEAVRPYLQEQSAALSDFILGDFRKNNDHVDVFYRRASNGKPYLYFVHPDDLGEGEPYLYDRPGFFRSPALRTEDKVSEVTIAGLVDSTHEKLEVPAGETVVYFKDDVGTVHRLRLVRAEGDDTLKAYVAAGVP